MVYLLLDLIQYIKSLAGYVYTTRVSIVQYSVMRTAQGRGVTDLILNASGYLRLLSLKPLPSEYPGFTTVVKRVLKY